MAGNSKRFTTSVSLDKEAQEKLLLICKKENRTQTNMIETLIKNYECS